MCVFHLQHRDQRWRERNDREEEKKKKKKKHALHPSRKRLTNDVTTGFQILRLKQLPANEIIEELNCNSPQNNQHRNIYFSQ